MSADYDGIVILGMPRSGTTLLRRLMNAHPRIHCPPETYLFGGASRFLAQQQSAGGLSTGVVPGLAFSGMGEEEVVGRLREFIFGFLSDLAAKAGKPRWAEKTATDVFHAKAIERICGGRCRYILLVRHPLDVVCSVQELCDRMQLYMTELHEYVRRYPAPLEAFAHAWCDANRALLELQAARSDACLRLRYEDLVTAPAAQMRAIFDFLGDPCELDVPSMAMTEVGEIGLGDWRTYEKGTVDAASVGRSGTLDPWTVSRLAAIVKPLMPALGYAPISVKPVPDEAVARRAYQLGRAAVQIKSGKPDKTR